MVFQAAGAPLADAPHSRSMAPAAPLAALARARGRPEQLATLQRSIAEEEEVLVGASAPGPALQGPARASKLRLLALSALRPAVELPASPLPAGPATPGARERLIVELCEHLASGGTRGALQASWREDLAARNPGAASHPEFPRLAEAVEALPALAEALRDLARAARVKRLAARATIDALSAAAQPLSPERFAGLGAGVPAAWLAALLPARLEPGLFARLAAECDAALDAAGRLREAQRSPHWELAALASVVSSRVCCALALCEEASFA